MKLERIDISGFRSIKATCLDDCGGFNVLIGQNNSGKSNILLAINGFFQCISGGQPVRVSPPHSDLIDHFEQKLNQPIDFSLTFQLTLSERDSLIQDIGTEAPNVKNTIEGMNPELRLRISVRIMSHPERSFAFVKEILLCQRQAELCSAQNVAATILRIDEGAGAELAGRQLAAQTKTKEIGYINEFLRSLRGYDGEEWKRLKDATARRLMAVRVSSPAPSTFIRSTLEELMRSSETQEKFREDARALSVQLQDEIASSLEKPLAHRVASFSGEEEVIPKYVTNLLRRIEQIKVLYLTERRIPIGKKEAKQLLELKIKRGGPEKLRTIQHTVSSLLGVEIDAFQSESAPNVDEPNAELDVDRFLVQVNGAGIREALRLILDYEFARPDILLVEEPEIHLHPALETSMMRYMKAIGAESQIFITTHSTNFLDTAELRNVYLISKDGSTNVQLINMEEAEQSIPRELGIRLSSIFMFDRLVFVEGGSDEATLREFAAILNLNLAQAGVGFVTMGGVRNLAAYATEHTVGFLSKRQVKLWFIIDRDERDDEEIRKLVNSLGEGASLHVLARREMENYLLAPRALAEFVILKKQLAGANGKPALSVEEVLTAIQETVEELKGVAVQRQFVKYVTVPIYLDRRSLLSKTNDALTEKVKEELGKQRERIDSLERELHEVATKCTQLVDEQWEARNTELVPGDVLLDEVCKKFGVRFNKERDSARLASLMNADEIAPEIHQLLKDIASDASLI